MRTQDLADGEHTFPVTVFDVARPRRTVLFGPGAGGSPARHLPLLSTLAESGCVVVAPHFDLIPPRPTEQQLQTRTRRMRLALDAFAAPDVPVAGVGHSIGGMNLIALAGGQVWMGVGHKLDMPPDRRLSRLALFAPAIGFFQAPGALDTIDVPLLVWAASGDTLMPPAQLEYLRQELAGRVPFELRVVEGAGHFSFMNVLPPHVTDPLPDRDVFLARLAAEVCAFVTA